MAKNFNVVKYINVHTADDGKCSLGYNKGFYNYLDNVDPESLTDKEKEALEKVIEVDWSWSNIYQLPRNLRVLTNLTVLDLSYNHITEIKEGTFRGLSNLTRLHLYNNQIKEINENAFRGLTYLTRLDLHNNQINEINKNAFRGLTYLTRLDLYNNQINDISPLSGLTSLTELYLRSNKITDISPLSGLTSLTYLYLGGLKLKSIPDSLIKIALDNDLEFYNDSNYHEKCINLKGTTLSEQDISMFFNRETLIEYYNAKEKVAINEVKVIFLGNGGAGKTHTVQRLLNGGKDVDFIKDETIGIQIDNYVTKTTKGEDMTLRLWDFGGQNYMHSMHRCFLTSNTIYVVVLYARSGISPTSNAISWMESIKSFAPNSRVIIAVNLWEGEVNIDIDGEELRKKYGDMYVNTVWYFARKIKPENEQMNDYLFNLLADTIKKTAEIMCEKQKTSKALAEVKKLITEEFKDNNFLTKEDYLEICDKVSKDLQADDQIDDKRAYNLLSICNDTGISVSRIKKDSNGEAIGVEDDTYTVLNPDWLFKGIYRIIATQKTLLKENSNGQVSTKTIEDTINDSAKSIIPTINKDGEPMEMEISLSKLTGNEAYKPEQCEAVLRIMRQYNMSADLGKNVEFIPAICSEKQPQALICDGKDKHDEPKYKEVVCLEYEYAYLPSTVIHQLMLNSLKNIEEGKKMKVMNPWQTGAEILYGDNIALIKTDEIRHTLIVNIYSTNDKDPAYTFIKSLNSMINNINNRLGISAISYLIVPSKKFPDKKASFRLDVLLMSYFKNRKDVDMHYYNNGDDEPYSLFKLLDKRYTKEDFDKIKEDIKAGNFRSIIEHFGSEISDLNFENFIKVVVNDYSQHQSGGQNNTQAGRDIIQHSYNCTEVNNDVSDIAEVIKTLSMYHKQIEEKTLDAMLEIIKANAKNEQAIIEDVQKAEASDKESKFDIIVGILEKIIKIIENLANPQNWLSDLGKRLMNVFSKDK